ncbi:MAG: SIS domain-containing protein [Candidatus Poseidoniales archaeon]|nr:MAG: SIS domain-containing protein [Candidatus Poseidoniales archaeon]
MPSPAVMGMPVSFEFDEFVDSYIADLKQALDGLSRDSLSEFWKMVESTRTRDGSIHFIGNGGSAATPSHSAGDWSKELGLRTIAHTDNTASMTAWANDTDYSNIFVGQLSTFLREGDMVVAYSGSGDSTNVVNGIRYANERGCSTVAVTGNIADSQGGKIAEISDLALVVPTGSMERIEDVQLVINHIIKEAVKAHNGL